MSTDAFGRLRVSGTYTTFDYYPTPLSSFENSKCDEDIWVTRSLGTTEYEYDKFNFIKLQCNVNKSYICRNTKQPMLYQSGKSRICMFTGVLLSRLPTSDENVISRVGLYNVNNDNTTEGVYLETDGKSLYIVEKTQTEIKKIIQSEWNVDKFDGTGPSSIQFTIENIILCYLYLLIKNG